MITRFAAQAAIYITTLYFVAKVHAQCNQTGITTSISHNIVRRGHNVTLSCYVSGSNGEPVSWVNPDGEFLSVGAMLAQNAGTQFSLTGANSDPSCIVFHLTITNLTQNDAGTYTCQPTSSPGPVSTEIVYFGYAPSIAYPECSVSGGSTLVRAGDALEFTCQSEKGDPEWNLTWLSSLYNLNAVPTVSATTSSRQIKTTKTTLNATSDQNGKIMTCFASCNDPECVDNQVRNCSLGPIIVVDNPVDTYFFVSQALIRVKEGDNVSVSCVTTLPGAEVTWFLRAAVTENVETTRSVSGNESTLKLYSIRNQTTQHPFICSLTVDGRLISSRAVGLSLDAVTAIKNPTATGNESTSSNSTTAASPTAASGNDTAAGNTTAAFTTTAPAGTTDNAFSANTTGMSNAAMRMRMRANTTSAPGTTAAGNSTTTTTAITSNATVNTTSTPLPTTAAISNVTTAANSNATSAANTTAPSGTTSAFFSNTTQMSNAALKMNTTTNNTSTALPTTTANSTATTAAPANTRETYPANTTAAPSGATEAPFTNTTDMSNAANSNSTTAASNATTAAFNGTTDMPFLNTTGSMSNAALRMNSTTDATTTPAPTSVVNTTTPAPTSVVNTTTSVLSTTAIPAITPNMTEAAWNANATYPTNFSPIQQINFTITPSMNNNTTTPLVNTTTYFLGNNTTTYFLGNNTTTQAATASTTNATVAATQTVATSNASANASTTILPTTRTDVPMLQTNRPQNTTPPAAQPNATVNATTTDASNTTNTTNTTEATTPQHNPTLVQRTMSTMLWWDPRTTFFPMQTMFPQQPNTFAPRPPNASPSSSGMPRATQGDAMDAFAAFFTLPIIVGIAAVGGLLLIIVVIIVIACVLTSRKHRTGRHDVEELTELSKRNSSKPIRLDPFEVPQNANTETNPTFNGFGKGSSTQDLINIGDEPTRPAQQNGSNNVRKGNKGDSDSRPLTSNDILSNGMHDSIL